MLSTINWVNRGDVSDGLTALFGGGATQARLVIDRAILDWEEVIVNFNYAGGGNTYNLTINTMDLTSIAQGGPSAADAQKRPTAGTITLDSVGTTHWVDPSVGDDAEFTTISNPFTGYAPSLGATAVDLYTTMVHEIGHCMGITQNAAYALRNFLTDTGIADPTGGTGNLWAYNFGGGAVEATFTAADTGHIWEGPGTAATGSLPWFVDELMNPGRAIANNERNLISNLDATILRDAYGYTIKLPSMINNMLVNPNFTSDVLTISGVPGGLNDSIYLNSAPGAIAVTVTGYQEIVPLSQISSISIAPGGGADALFLNYNAARPTTYDGGSDGATDELYIVEGATVTSSTVTSSYIGTVTYSNVEALILNGSTGNDVFSVLGTFSLTPVTINGGNGEDTLYINPASGALFGYGSAITWNGGGSVDKLQFDLQFSGFNDRYTVRSNQVVVQELNGIGNVTVNQIGYSIIDSVVVNAGSGNDEIILPDVTVKGTFSGAGGNDTFTVGGGNLGLSVNTSTLSGGGGTDTLVLDDSAYAGAVDWAIDDTGVFRETIGVQSYSYVGFEGVGVRLGAGGTRGNWFDVIDALYVNLTITGGVGIDEVRFNNFSNVHLSGISIVTYPMHFNGGGGLNNIVVNDQTRSTTFYELRPDRIEISELLISDSADFTYANIGAMTFNASNSNSFLDVFGTPSSIFGGQQITFLANGGNDAVTLYPHDAVGNLTINGNLGIGGGSGSDTLTINDTGYALPVNYRFYNQFGPGTTNIGGMGAAGFGAGSDFETIVVNAGGGDDTFRIDSFQSGSSLAINAGNGNDTLDITPVSKNVSANVTSISSFNFAGGDGYDAFNLYNDNNTSPWNYTRTSGYLRTDRQGGPLYFLILNQQNVEFLSATGGTQADQVFVQSTPAGSINQFDGAGGSDSYFLGSAMSTAGITGGVYLYDSAGTDSVSIDDRASGVGKTLHVDANFVGAAAGDNLFGPGGFLYHVAIAGAMTIKLGSGADTVFAVPLAATPLFIEANAPATLPGDTLNLGLAAAVNPVFTPGVPGEGAYTFDNAAFLYYSGFESTVIDDVAPSIVSQVYDDSGPVPAIVVEFSEDVSTALGIAYLVLFNDTLAEQVPYAVMAVSYDSGTNTATFTFPGYPDGKLPVGDYTATILGSLTDSFGNAMGVETPFNFSVLAPPPIPGDLNFDGYVDLVDVQVVGLNWGLTGPPGPPNIPGDANGDGIVNLVDVQVVGLHWHDGTPPGGGAATGGGAGSGGGALRQPLAAQVADGAPIDTASLADAALAELDLVEPRLVVQSAAEPEAASVWLLAAKADRRIDDGHAHTAGAPQAAILDALFERLGQERDGDAPLGKLRRNAPGRWL